MSAAKVLAGLRCEPALDGAVLHLVLDAGKGNVVDRALCEALAAAAAVAAAEPTLVAVVLDHEGPHFSYGASVPEHAPGEVARMLGALHDAARALLALDVPLLAAVRGLCLGGGLELALLADRVACDPTARFAQPEAQLGVFAPIGSALLPRLIGARPAADLLLSGRTVTADEARALGLVAEIAEDPRAATLSWAREHLVSKSARALRFVTSAARRAWRAPFLADLAALERTYLGELMATRDAQEGIAAFLEKRPPRWEHR